RAQFVQPSDAFQVLKSCFWSTNIRERNGTVESDDRRVIEFHQPIVQRKDLPPVGRLVVLCGAVTSCYSGLKMILAELVACCRLTDMKQATCDHGFVLVGTVLFVYAQQIALSVQTCCIASRIQQ